MAVASVDRNEDFRLRCGYSEHPVHCWVHQNCKFN